MLKNKLKNMLYISVASLAFLSGCSDIDNTGKNVVNADARFVSAEVIEDINTSTMLSVVKAGVDATATNAFGYKAVKIVYETQDISGNDVNASGLLVIPSASDAYKQYLASQGKAFSVSMICDNHGTIFTNAEAPSNVETTNGLPDYDLATSMTGYAGFAAVLPDYVGYGSSNDSNHPYLLKEISAQNSLDMIKASMKYMEDSGVALNYQLYISGYSQGGHVAMALGEKIEKENFDIVDLKGIAPMAGPYLISSFGDAVLKADATMSVPAFMAYIADSYSNAHDNISLDEMIISSKVSAFDGLFDGSNDATAIHTTLGLSLGASTTLLFDTNFVSDYEATPSHKLRARFVENNVGSWGAKTKINLIHCTNDDVVPYTMTQGVKQTLDAAGAVDVTLTPISSVADGNVHSDCGLPAYSQAIGWFDEIRQGKL
jgi:predicted esterase